MTACTFSLLGASISVLSFPTVSSVLVLVSLLLLSFFHWRTETDTGGREERKEIVYRTGQNIGRSSRKRFFMSRVERQKERRQETQSLREDKMFCRRANRRERTQRSVPDVKRGGGSEDGRPAGPQYAERGRGAGGEDAEKEEMKSYLDVIQESKEGRSCRMDVEPQRDRTRKDLSRHKDDKRLKRCQTTWGEQNEMEDENKKKETRRICLVPSSWPVASYSRTWICDVLSVICPLHSGHDVIPSEQD